MTRTERAVFPRAIVKDRHESKTGLDKSLRKNGAGQHNWGSLADEGKYEAEALEDEELEFNHQEDRSSRPQENVPKPSINRSPSEEERASARNFRKNALKGEGLDLAAIARTSSAVSTSPPAKASPIANGADTSIAASA